MKQNLPNLHSSSYQTWKLMREIKQTISRKRFMDCLGVKSSQENRFCQRPDHADHRRNPIDRMLNLIEVLVEKNGTALARTTINLIATPLKCRLTPITSPTPDKTTIFEECVDDYCEKSKLDELIKSGADIEDVMQQAEACKREIDETIVMYKDYKSDSEFW